MRKKRILFSMLCGLIHLASQHAFCQLVPASKSGAQIAGTYHIFRMAVYKEGKDTVNLTFPSIMGSDTLSAKLVVVQKSTNQVTCNFSQSQNSFVLMSFSLGGRDGLTLKPSGNGYNLIMGLAEIGHTDGKLFSVDMYSTNKQTGAKSRVTYEGRKE